MQSQIVNVAAAARVLTVAKYLTTLAFMAALILLPSVGAFAANAGGGGMPYSAGLATFTTSVQTEIAFFLIVVAIVCGVGGYIMQGQLTGLMETVGRVMIGIAIIGGVAAFAALAGVAGAVA